jgi:hypothetical protein
MNINNGTKLTSDDSKIVHNNNNNSNKDVFSLCMSRFAIQIIGEFEFNDVERHSAYQNDKYE